MGYTCVNRWVLGNELAYTDAKLAFNSRARVAGLNQVKIVTIGGGTRLLRLVLKSLMTTWSTRAWR